MTLNYKIYFESELRGKELVLDGGTDKGIEDIITELEYYRDNEETEISGQYIAEIDVSKVSILRIGA